MAVIDTFYLDGQRSDRKNKPCNVKINSVNFTGFGAQGRSLPLFRYERETFDALPHVFNRCFRIAASFLTSDEQSLRLFDRALLHACHTVTAMESLLATVHQWALILPP